MTQQRLLFGPGRTDTSPPMDNGWVITSYMLDNGAFLAAKSSIIVSMNFNVPVFPTEAAQGMPQTTYIYPYFQNSTYIIQPVLAIAGGGTGATAGLMSEIVSSGIQPGGSSIPANPGDMLTATMELDVAAGMWSVTASNENNLDQPSIASMLASEFGPLWSTGSCGIAQESYLVTDCAQLPPTPVVFSNILVSIDGTNIFFDWQSYSFPKTLSCGQGISQVSSTEMLMTFVDG